MFANSKYIVDNNHSIVNFSTIKTQYVVESAAFKRVGETVSDSGDVEIIIDLNSIDLNSIDTNIAIRDTRIGELFFEVIKFPNAIIRAKIDMEKIKSIS
ncbi:MAG: YceI family protein [Endozoicomonadaceae bacterium]|nr:YceI family protein [Endozoicomonadaceae bacterium]